jgi:AbrB family looped-hinge helix DNA binding protein
MEKEMETAKITFKGQVTIPKKVRISLGIQAGDSLIFSIEGDRATITPYKKKSLGDFYGVLPATRAYPGPEAVRSAVQKDLSRKMTLKDKA